MGQKNIKANNYSIFIYLFRYISSVENDASFSLLALKPCCGPVSSSLGVKVIFRKKCLQSIPSFDAKHMNKM